MLKKRALVFLSAQSICYHRGVRTRAKDPSASPEDDVRPLTGEG
jgi:hypothetical protein